MAYLSAFVAATGALLIATAAAAEQRPVVVELFTSEGCNSCPPAEAYVGKLSTRPDILALSFHVDYWDSQGWRDRFALPQSAERQSVYARTLHRATVYTPQIVVDGRADYFKSDEGAVSLALAGSRDGIPIAVSTQDSQVIVELGASAKMPPSDVILVAYLRHAVSSVRSGENAGRTLEEFNVVRYIQTLGHSNGQLQEFRVPISSLPSEATDVAVLVQPRGQAPIVGAAAHSLR